jgi:GNAT superfamily N-acetyltransferase
MEIRDAVPADAAAAWEVLRRSITELCVADHGDDPVILQRWLANKTPESIASWIAQTVSSMLVAVEDGKILAVGAVTDAGEITLNYVSPEARFRGVSRALLRALESRAVKRGSARCTLLSTETARRFYHDAGYAEEGPPQGKFGTSSGYPMSKRLPPADVVAVRLDRVVKELPAGFDSLRAGARAEGYRHLERLADDWASGAIRFDRDGEALLVAHVGSEIAAVGGLTVDPAWPEALRMRRFYVAKRFRRCGIGRRLAAALLEPAVQAGLPVTVNAAAGSAFFWESIGFVADERDGHTHMLKRRQT